MRDFPRTRETTNRHNAERIKAFARDFAGVRLSDVDRPTAREWAHQHPQLARYARTMFEDARNDGPVDATRSRASGFPARRAVRTR
jgi:hypothetical protein